ncbi:MAG: hypothetical protein IKU52_04280 [Clostridia bacterium]|nr:hypothetical protein [Clostridia bacterium]
MICENVFCVYNHNNRCIVNEPELDIMGMCRACVYVEPDAEYIKCLKIKMLKNWGDDDLAEIYYKDKKAPPDTPNSAPTLCD